MVGGTPTLNYAVTPKDVNMGIVTSYLATATITKSYSDNVESYLDCDNRVCGKSFRDLVDNLFPGFADTDSSGLNRKGALKHHNRNRNQAKI